MDISILRIVSGCRMDASMQKVTLRKGGSRGRRTCRAVVVGLAFLIALGGCTRAFYRKQADKEVNDVLKEKDQYAEWKIEQFHVYPDARARFAEPNNPDRTPMPPDDEPAYKLSPHPQGPGHAGVGKAEGTAYLEMMKIWDTENRAERGLRAAESAVKDAASADPTD